MKKKQRILYKALEVIATSTMTLEDSAALKDEDLTKEDIEEVIKKISEKYFEYKETEFYEEVYNYGTYANTVLSYINNKLEVDNEE